MMAYYITQMQQHIHQLYDQMNSLENRIQQLEQNASPKTTIEKLEYHFDQLKIERLDGTLHIGVSPDDLQKIDDFTLPKQQQSEQMPLPAHHSLEQYIEQEMPAYTSELEQQYNYPLDNQYRQVLMEDLKKQLASRIAYYQQTNLPPNQLHQHIFTNVKKELQLGLRKWFENHKKE